MNITPFDIYLLGLVGNVKECFFLLSLFSEIAVFVSIMFLSFLYDRETYSSDEDKKAGKSLAKKMLIIAIIIISIDAAIPSSKTFAAMYMIPAITNNEKIQNIGTNGLEILEAKTQGWLKDLKGGKVEK